MFGRKISPLEVEVQVVRDPRGREKYKPVFGDDGTLYDSQEAAAEVHQANKARDQYKNRR